MNSIPEVSHLFALPKVPLPDHYFAKHIKSLFHVKTPRSHAPDAKPYSSSASGIQQMSRGDPTRKLRNGRNEGDSTRKIPNMGEYGNSNKRKQIK
jgi:hypothetical protein